MEPVILHSSDGALVLDQPADADIDDIARYCADPLFERFMLTPWPYERHHAAGFVRDFVPEGWRSGRECTWAIRRVPGAELLGVIGLRVHDTPGESDVGFWLGSPHRGQGVMTRATDAVVDWAFDGLGLDTVLWECVPGNIASARTARATGFRHTGVGPSLLGDRHGEDATAWHGIRTREDAAPDAASSWTAVLGS